MILSKEFLRANKNYVNETKTPVLVLDLKHFQYFNDVERFGFAVEVLNVVNSISWVNKVCIDLNSNYCIDTWVFYEIMDCLFAEKGLDDSRLAIYFKVQQDLENILIIFQKVAETDKNFDLPIEVDLLIFGADLEKYHTLNGDVKSDLHDGYAVLYSKMRSNEMGVPQFISQAKKLLSAIEAFESELV